MPTVAIHGGLGNQLFQYAVGRALSTKTNSKLWLETSAFTRQQDSDLPARSFQLSQFEVQGTPIHNPIDENNFLKLRFKTFDLLRGISSELAARVGGVHKDLRNPHQFSPCVLRMSANAFLYGYYQSEKYFHEIGDTLRREISLSSPPSGPNEQWKEQVERFNSVGIHVRRGDYVKQGWSLPADYYRSAIEAMNSLTDDMVLFFFSDDIQWVQKHSQRLLPKGFSIANVNYVDCNDGEHAHEDLRLMRSCRHNIITNSTFSWWGAWLNRNSEKIVLAPHRWLNDCVAALDILPERWRVVEW